MSNAAALRRLLINRRDMLGVAERSAKSDAIWKQLVEVPAFQGAEQALFFISHNSEVDTTMMRRMTRQMGMTVCAPRSQPGNRSMQFYVVPDEEAFESGPYGILQPMASLVLADLRKPSVVIVPGVGFDRKGNRIGFGGGYYDRWLAAEGKGLPTVALAYDEQIVEKIPVQAHDVPVQVIVTDKETLICSPFQG